MRKVFLMAAALTLAACNPQGAGSGKEGAVTKKSAGPGSSATSDTKPKAGEPAAKAGAPVSKPVAPEKAGATAPPAPPGMLKEPALWDTVDEVTSACDAHLAAAARRRDAIKGFQGKRTLDHTLVQYDDMLIEIDRILPLSELIANVHPDKAVRDAAEKCQQRAMKFLSDIKLDRGLYDALTKVERKGLDQKATRFLDHLLRDYRRAGVDKDEATRKELARIHDEMVKTGQEFSRNIREDKRYIEVDGPAALAGMPKDFIESHEPGEGGKIRITTDYPDFFPFQKYAKDEALRKKLYEVFLTRAYPANAKVLLRLLELRHRYAKLLGYPDWAEYNAEDKMVEHEAVIRDFIEKVAGIARPRMEQDLALMLERKRKDDPKADRIYVWDRFYYVRLLRAEKYGVDAQKVREYFPFERVKAGILGLAQELFGLEFKKVEGAKVWHPEVEAYDVYDHGERIARFYLDLHPRDGKYGHAAEFPILTGVPGRQLPAAALVCNFPDPSKGDGQALMEHGDVTTFFHEFGHLMHHLLSGKQPWVTQSGINCEWDFVEAPSQLLEEWTWDPTILRRFGKHYETNQPIPADLVQRMRKADELGKGVHVMRQMFYAALSYYLHSRDPKGLDLVAALKDIQAKYNPYPYQEGTYVFANFGHLEGYSSMYYTYMWSLVLAKDLFTKFQANGLLDHDTAMAYRKAVLEPGGSKDAADMVEDFLGRPYSFDAFERWLKGE